MLDQPAQRTCLLELRRRPSDTSLAPYRVELAGDSPSESASELRTTDEAEKLDGRCSQEKSPWERWL